MNNLQYGKNYKGMKIQKSMYAYMLDDIYHSPYGFNTYITLTSNYDYSIKAINDKVNHWKYRINCRLFSNTRFHNNNDDDVSKKYDLCFRYFGYLEYTLSGTPHYHFLAYVHPERIDYFKRIAPIFWKKLVKQATTDIQDITKTESRLVNYVIKKLNTPLGYENFIIS